MCVCLCEGSVYLGRCVCLEEVVSVEQVYLGQCVCEGDVSRGVGVSGGYMWVGVSGECVSVRGYVSGCEYSPVVSEDSRPGIGGQGKVEKDLVSLLSPLML